MKVGIGVDPETKGIECYKLENLTIWDTPGIGDNTESDREHSVAITKKLSGADENGVSVIGLVMIITDGSTRDMSALYNMINNTIIPSLTKKNANRILIAVNQADMAMKCRYGAWHTGHVNRRSDRRRGRRCDWLFQGIV